MMTSAKPPDLVPRRALASFHPERARLDPFFRDWLLPQRDGLFRWTLQRASDEAQRRSIAELAVAIQRLRGADGYGVWLFGAALLMAQRQAARGGLPEAALAGLVPELRAVLRLVADQVLRPEEAQALLPQRMGYVRLRLVQARLGG